MHTLIYISDRIDRSFVGAITHYTRKPQGVNVAPHQAFHNMSHLQPLDVGDDDSGEMVEVVSSEGDRFTINIDHVMNSSLLFSSLMNVSGTTLRYDGEPLVFHRADSKSLRLIVAYMTHYEGREPERIAKPLRPGSLAESGVDLWAMRFIADVARDKIALIRLIITTNFMGPEALFQLASAQMAMSIRGRPTSEFADALTP